MLKGKKVLLRPIRKSDISLFLKWFNDPEVTQYLGVYLPFTEIEEERWIEELATAKPKRDIVFIVEIIENNITKPIGNCGLYKINQKDQNAEIALIIGEKDYWGKGYGTEALQLLIDYGFNQLNLHRIFGFVIEFNERNIKLCKKLRFKEEGRLREARFKNGRFWDVIIFGLLREEWMKEKLHRSQ